MNKNYIDKSIGNTYRLYVEKMCFLYGNIF